MSRVELVFRAGASGVLIASYAFATSAIGRGGDCLVVALLFLVACASLEKLEEKRR